MKCPGQDTRYWKEDAIFEVKCPHCGETVEFFKDDTSRPCPGCGRRLPNPRLDFGCAAYCPYAEQCLGALPSELREKQQAVFKDRIEAEIIALFKEREDIIKTLKTRLKYAEQIALEEGAKLPLVLAASLLCELEPREVSPFLQKINVPSDMREAVIEVLEGEYSLEARVLNDAILLTRKEAGHSVSQAEIKTATGKRIFTALEN